jgi:cytosine/adenosine deaminase-related metal-dependent hydrolase
VYVGNLITSLQCLDAGVTTILDNSHNARTADHSNAAVEALFDAGIRAVHAFGAPRAGTWDQQWPRDIMRLRDEYFSSRDQLVTLRLFDAFPVSDVWEFAKTEGLWVSTEMGSHVGNLKDLHAARLLTAEHTFNHCFGVSDDDWLLIQYAGVRVNVCPRSDASFRLGFGSESMRKALSLGIRPGLSMDNEVSYGIDMFVEMQTLLLQQRARTFETTLAGEPDVPNHLGLGEVLEFATVRGAQNCDLEDKVGSLIPGKEADIVLVRTTDISTFPLTNTLATLVTFASRGNVDTVFVAGTVRKWRGRLVGHDLAKIQKTVETSRDYLLSAQGLTSDPFAERGSKPINT